MLKRIRHLGLAGVSLSIICGSAVSAGAACIPDKLPSPAPRDPVARVLALQATCPPTPIAFRNALKKSGARLEPTMVNFDGFHNAESGDLFIFEIVSATTPALPIARGDLVFGHFLGNPGDGRLVSNTSFLSIELIAWDPDKQFYNFYELRDGTWSYKGDSADILDDIRLLHRERPATAKPFGQRLRCSGCHVNGGLLQKELVAPHNDWFLQSRHLPLGTLEPDAAVKEILADVVDAEQLSTLVAASPRRLADSVGYRKALAAHSLQEQLRPLFCPVEVNVESDSEPFDDGKAVVRVPSGFFVDSRLATAEVSVPRIGYEAALKKLGARLGGSGARLDADHAWLTPVKAHSDIVAVDSLIERGIITREFAADVLAVDFTNPVFSATRCGLLKLVPEPAAASFVPRFQDALRSAGTPGAVELLGNLTDPGKTAALHEKRAAAFTAGCRQRASDPAVVLDWFRLLAQRRSEVSASEISQNSRGHILEDPGRIVFPSVTQPRPVPGLLTLSATCQVN